MKPKQLLKQFKEVPWTSQQQLEEVARASLSEGLDADAISRMLGMLLDSKLAGDSWKGRMRMMLFAQLAPRVIDAGLCLPYVRALGSAPTALRQLLIDLIPKVEHPSAHAELCAYLRSPEKTLRHMILGILPQMQRQGIASQLHKLIKHPDFPGAQEVLELLLQIDYANAMVALEHTIKKGEPAAQETALQYLAKRGKGRADAALNLIRPALQSPVERVRIAAIEAFSAVCQEPLYFDVIAPLVDDNKVSVGRAALRGAQHFRSKRTMRLLERAFAKGPEGISLTVLQVLEAIGTDAILPLLVKALAHPQLMVRSQAGDVLANLGREGKVELARAVIWLLRSRDENVRRMAAELSRSVSDPQDQFWPKLMTFLLDEDWWVRERVMDTLMESASEMLARYVVQYLSAPSSVVRLFAVEVLGRLKKPEALGILVRTALNDQDWWVREKSIEAIGELGDPRGVAYIIDILRREESLQWSCVQTLDKLRATEAAPHVAVLLRSHSSDIRLVALRCLESFRAMQHAADVEPLQQDPDPEVRKRAHLLIEQWKIRSEYGQQNQMQHVEPLDQLLIHAHQMNCDDLLLAPSRRAFIKHMGKVSPLSEYRFTDEQLRNIILPHLMPQQLKQLNQMGEIDFSHEIKEKRLRFRAHVFLQHDGIAAVFRLLRNNWLRLPELGLPPIVRTFGEWKDGLVLVGGPTGSGKTMTISALIDEINQTSNRHIISLEDPIEVIHRPSSSLINQREIGTHTRSFANALRSTLRQDPDVILVGEMRDLETISFAMTAADTGHLVLGTLHTVSADSTIDRILNAYPSNQQEQARSMLAQNLRVVLCQNLLRGKSGAERHLAAELMLNNDAIANMIRKGKTHQISSTIGSSRDMGMQTMDQEITRLHQEGLITPEEAYLRARNKKEFEWMVGGEEAAEMLNYSMAKRPARSEAALAAVEYHASQDGMPSGAPGSEGRSAPGSMSHLVAHANRAQAQGKGSAEQPSLRASTPGQPQVRSAVPGQPQHRPAGPSTAGIHSLASGQPGMQPHGERAAQRPTGDLSHAQQRPISGAAPGQLPGGMSRTGASGIGVQRSQVQAAMGSERSGIRSATGSEQAHNRGTGGMERPHFPTQGAERPNIRTPGAVAVPAESQRPRRVAVPPSQQTGGDVPLGQQDASNPMGHRDFSQQAGAQVTQGYPSGADRAAQDAQRARQILAGGLAPGGEEAGQETNRPTSGRHSTEVPRVGSYIMSRSKGGERPPSQPPGARPHRGDPTERS